MILRSLFIIGALALLSSCGADKSQNGSTTAGTVTFSGTGVTDIYTGANFTPEFGGLGVSRNLATDPNNIAFTWNVFAPSKQTTIRYYTYMTNPAATPYNLTISSYSGSTANTAEWNIHSNTAITGISYNSAAKQITFTNVSIDGYANINATPLVPSNIILNGTLTHR